MIFDKQASLNPWQLVRSLAYRVLTDSLLRNSIYIMATAVVTSGFGYIYWIVAAHIYSAHDVGLASAFISVMTLISTFANLGMGSTLVHMLPGRKSGHAWSLTFNAGLATGIISGLLAGIAIAVVLPLFSPQFSIIRNQISYALVLILGVPIMTISTLLDQAFVAERAASNMLLRNAALAMLKIPLMVLPFLLSTRVGALGIFSSGVLAAAITVSGGMLLLVPRLKRAYRLTVHRIVGEVHSMLSTLAGNHFINIGGLTPMYLIPVFVAIQLSPTDNAYFYTTTRLGDFFFMISSVVSLSLFAEGSHAVNSLPNKVRSSIVIVSLLLVPAMLVCYFGGGYILLIFGPHYAQRGLPLLRILAIGAVPDAITNIYVSVLRVQRRLRHAIVLNLTMASIDLMLAWILLPILGITGAGWSFLVAQVVGSLVAGVDFLQHLYRCRSSELAVRSNSDLIQHPNPEK